MSALASPQQVIARLQEIEHDLAERQNDWEEAAADRARLIRDWEHRYALCMKKAQGPNSEARKAAAFVMAAEMDDLYRHLTEAESTYEALRAVVKVLETRSTIGMSILRSQGRG